MSKKYKSNVLLLGLVIGFVAGLIVGLTKPYFSKSNQIEEQKTEYATEIQNWKQYSDDILSFKYPSEWEVDKITDEYVLWNSPEQYGEVLKLMYRSTTNDKTGKLVELEDYFHFDNNPPEMFDIRRNDNRVAGYEALRILSNVNSIQTLSNERLIIKIDDKSKLAIIDFSPEDQASAMEKKVLDIFEPLISTIDIH